MKVISIILVRIQYKKNILLPKLSDFISFFIPKKKKRNINNVSRAKKSFFYIQYIKKRLSPISDLFVSHLTNMEFCTFFMFKNSAYIIPYNFYSFLKKFH